MAHSSEMITAGAALAHGLAEMGVTHAFGVISIHNMPILDAMATQQRIRFVGARGEAGAMNMADAYARVSRGLGVVITSTGTAAGNAAGAQVEALSACSRVLHITSTVDTDLMDRDRAAIHDVPRQADMLKAISKAFFRVNAPRELYGKLAAAVGTALSAPQGPVTLEIPIDVQRALLTPPRILPAPNILTRIPDSALLDHVAGLVRAARRPMLLLGGGARAATLQAGALVAMGFGVATSTNGRAVVPESDARSLGAFNMTPQTRALYATCDLMIMAGTRLRGNETLNNKLALPRPLVQIDADAAQAGRNHAVDVFIEGDAVLALQGLVDRLGGRLDVDPGFAYDIAVARAGGEGDLRSRLGPYQTIADDLLGVVAPGGHAFVRDVTISNSTFGNRYVHIKAPHLGVHAVGGGIGQGIAMALGAALANPSTKTIALMGDGGTMLNLGEWMTAVEERANIVFILMNDQAYGVIRNIQDAQYGARHVYSAPKMPDFGALARSFGLGHRRISDVAAFRGALDAALATPGPQVLEVDMNAIGPFAEAFGGPPAGAAGAKP
ncbi:MAG: thiamine pyrophosphate-binding protein [Hyphomicrobiales bacterium]|nr:thiamine pyrophosphate-binding protein [Hyphomicrobiales bacterium]